MAWQPYKPGIAIVDRQVRVAGPAGNYVEVTNVANKLACRLASGLVGHCELITPNHAKLLFYRATGNNSQLWHKCTGFTTENKATGLIAAYVHTSRLRGFEVGDGVYNGKLPVSGTAMGVRG